MGRVYRLLDAWNALRRREARRPGGRAGAGGTARRALAFERFEPRIALSAAVQSAFAGDAVRTEQTVVIARLWSASAGAENWPTATFAIVNPGGVANPGPPNAEAPGAGLGDTLELRSRGEGGLAAYNGNGFTLQFSDGATQLSRWMVTNAYGVNSGIAFDVGPTWSRDTVVENLGLDFSDLDSAPFEGDSTVLVGAADEAGTAPPVDGVRASSPVLRIAAPLRQESREGGAIDLMALVAPRAPLEAPRGGYSAAASPLGAMQTDLGLARRDQTPRSADAMRARAVMFEVALAGENLESPQRDFQREAPSAANGQPVAPRPEPRDPGGAEAAPLPEAEAVGARRDTVARTGPTETTTLDEQAQAEATAAAAARTAARDEALSELGEAPPIGEQADSRTRRRDMGLAMALVVGAAPMAKRLRRRQSKTIAEQSAGIQ